MAAVALVTGLLEESSLLVLYVWLDLQKTGYGFGYGSLWSLAILVHRPAEPSPFALKSSVRIRPWKGRSSTSSTTSGEGDRLRCQVVAMGVANIITRPVSRAAPGYGEGPERYSHYAPTTASSQWRLRQ